MANRDGTAANPSTPPPAAGGALPSGGGETKTPGRGVSDDSAGRSKGDGSKRQAEKPTTRNGKGRVGGGK